MKSNTDYKNDALSALKGNWSQAVLAVLLVFAFCVLVMIPYYFKYYAFIDDPTNLDALGGVGIWGMAGYVAILLVGWPLMIGMVNAFKNLLVKGENRLTEAEVRIAFGHWLHNFWGNFLRFFFTALWSLLFVIPGIVKSLAYAMTAYILEDYPELSANKAIDLSQEMMKGHKYDLFYLYLSFFGWYLLSMLTLGIGLLWLIPYAQTAQASFYCDVKAEWEARASGKAE